MDADNIPFLLDLYYEKKLAQKANVEMSIR